MDDMTSSLEAPFEAWLALSSLSTSSSFRTAIFPCFRIHFANFGSVASIASAKSFRLHTDL